MLEFLHFLIILIALFFFEIIYFKIADHYNIIDKPNARSSHSTITLRGGGIIFVIAGLIFYLFAGFQYSFFIIGLFAIGTISFLDDILTLNNKIRLGVHLLAVLLLFYQWQLFVLPWYVLIIAAIFVIGTINAYNFMDGINGITGGYSLITIASLYYINTEVVVFTSNDLLIIVGLSLLVFNFFNFRKKAKCFAGDVGSVSIAFIITFLVGQLILKSESSTYILLLLFYGLDTATTVFFRKIRKENIFKAHRSHFYQYLANQLKWNHLIVSGLYVVVQLLINCTIVLVIKDSMVFALIFITVFTTSFFIMRFLVEGKTHLLKSH
ncbi:glycosyltransferase family 4 protein [Pedobacter polaris]|uniref:Glycosyltransferase family 4 protein n=1 Tax=Pedobacter polaris TaxID=2571273 RepID=A0A4U1CZN7_9SPHI|nr:glycosyltransferase family 4 protein [Pedobacter polaris]TKC13078.1 glycosyltransferase family 4 protein [Pedobacter polaris]